VSDSIPQNDPQELLASLRCEHEAGLKYVRRLESAASAISHDAFSAGAFEEIARTVRWINTSVADHLKKEENSLFSLMDLQSGGLADEIRTEHAELRIAFAQLIISIQDMERGNLRAWCIQDVVQASEHVAQLLERHIAKEERILKGLAQRIESHIGEFIGE